MSKLIPTPRVDRNGVATIRHMKPDTVSANRSAVGKPLPAPTAVKIKHQDKLAARQELRHRIFEIVGDPNSNGPANPAKLRKALATIHNSDYLQCALAVAEAITASKVDPDATGHSYDYWVFADELKKRTPIEIAHRNLDLIRNSDNMRNGFASMVALHQRIASRRTDNDDFPIVIDRMDNHLFAYNTLRDSAVYGNPSDWSNYVDNYAPLISRYPDHCENLCTYLMERGGAESFDESGFLEYLNTTAPLAEGTL